MRLSTLAACCTLTVSALSAQGLEIGGKAPALTFADSANTMMTLTPSNAPATVVVFVSSRCPVSQSYNDRMRALYDTYANKQVQFAFVSANVNEVPAELAKLQADAKFPFTVYHDADNTVADALGAQVTPEVFVFDKDGILRYHGAIDDSRDAANVKTQHAGLALDAVLANKTPDVATTKAFGCSIKRKRAA